MTPREEVLIQRAQDAANQLLDLAIVTKPNEAKAAKVRACARLRAAMDALVGEPTSRPRPRRHA